MVFREEMASQSDRRTLSRELLRDVNQRVASLGSRGDEILSFLCECADEFCVDQVVLQLARYEEIRGSGGYILAPGHRTRQHIFSLNS
jgi:hypothetical protein